MAAASEKLQLYQVHLWLLDCQLPAAGQGLSGCLTAQQLEQCRASWQEQLAGAKASRLQHSVYKALQQLPADMWQQPPGLEQHTADGNYSIDIAAETSSGVAVAIEVDGPNHFLHPDNVVDGATQSRNRALGARGYQLISIPYWDWFDLQTSEQQQHYLVRRLQEATSGAPVKQ